MREDPLVHPDKWLRPGKSPPGPFLLCKPHLTPGGSGVLSDPARIDEEFRKAWIPYFCRSGQREAIFEKFAQEFEGCPVVALAELTGEMLAEVFRGKGALQVVLMGGVGRN